MLTLVCRLLDNPLLNHTLISGTDLESAGCFALLTSRLIRQDDNSFWKELVIWKRLEHSKCLS